MKTESEQSFVVKATEKNIECFDRPTDSRSLGEFVTSRLAKFNSISSDSSLYFGPELDI